MQTLEERWGQEQIYIRSAVQVYLEPNRKSGIPATMQKQVSRWAWFVDYIFRNSDIEHFSLVDSFPVKYRRLKMRFQADGIFGDYTKNPELMFLFRFIQDEIEKILNRELLKNAR